MLFSSPSHITSDGQSATVSGKAVTVVIVNDVCEIRLAVYMS